MDLIPLSTKISKVRELEKAELNWKNQVSVRFLRNYTLENIEPLLKFACYKNEIKTLVSFSAFDTFEQEILDLKSQTYVENPDFIVLSLFVEGLLDQKNIYDFEAGLVFSRLKNLIDTLKRNTSARIITHTFTLPFFALNNNGAINHSLSDLNHRLQVQYGQDDQVFLMNFGEMVNILSQAKSFDRRFWYRFRSPYTLEFLDLFSQEISKVIQSETQANKKVLVLDCDNTLWKGVVGEDGINGIELGPESPSGHVHYDFQRQILELKSRGVLLALCSKNNEEDVFEVFEKHPHSLLKKFDFAAHQINWQNKADNMRNLAQILNLGLNSFVFIDDSPAECELLKREIPEVTVLEFPSHSYDLVNILSRYGGFNRYKKPTKEDVARTQMYHQEAQRHHLKSEATDLESYLKSLNLEAEIRPMKESEMTRVAQLTQKTNQFNLTTRRYTEKEIRGFFESPCAQVFVLKAKDQFGDYGLAASAIVLSEGQETFIDTLLMSCRILGRDFEKAFLSEIVRQSSKRWNTVKFRSRFIPTPKNSQVSKFYDVMEFDLLPKVSSNSSDSGREYVYDSSKTLPKIPPYIKLNYQEVEL